MRTNEFNERYEIDRGARGGVRATPKPVIPELQPAVLADGSSYRDGQILFFVDRQQAFTVRSTDGLRRVGGEHLGAEGLKVVQIDDCYANRNDAIDRAQRLMLDEIEQLRDKIQALEDSKPKSERSLKRILQARGL